ncbi:hypothetical protein H8356DRAFT_1077933 [Neocallimastix lanati (nom. inval.)]|uniref:Uncharacterized protein n=1 Tax=Neocallimastix californiae TaxID=1754190 RepID=A0A1Y1ZW50_9FUNG|nr:hypothetical protein H8356DRAFT_1077933 [Neocallimastix sp. JGI-2020a]ORY14489.1 hypothetical protein LY90DRAFT_518035 [Neocallimastix californiae]|eukprot:ORY14489.1 hypothetical protein LY90DRAFT_518035 [Neocallimastix californiae]
MSKGIIARFESLLGSKIVLLIIVFLITWSIPTIIFQYLINLLFKKKNIAYSDVAAYNISPVFIGLIDLIDLIFINTKTNSTMGSTLYSGTSVIICLVLTVLCPVFDIVALLNALFTLKLYNILFLSDLTIKTIMNNSNMISPLIILFLVFIFVYSFL